MNSRSVAEVGSYARLLARLAKLDLIALDDWLLAPLTDAERRASSRSLKIAVSARPR